MATLSLNETQSERAEAQRVVSAVAPDKEVTLTIRTSESSGNQLVLSPELSSTVLRVLAIMAEGGTATFGGMPEVLTTSEAARVLGISRPTLMKRLHEGILPSFKVGTHTRLRRDDVLSHVADREQEKMRALDELRELEFTIDSLATTENT